MLKVLKYGSVVILFLLVGYGLSGYVDAALHATSLQKDARSLIAQQKSSDALGLERLDLLLRVQDPSFQNHNGIDFKSDGAGLTTITQSLAKRLAFKTFKPGIGKIKQTAYAISLEQRLNKDEILALFLESVPMGQGPDGWTTGFFVASQSFYGAPPAEISIDEYIELVSVLIAPGKLNHLTRNKNFEVRIARIARLQQRMCKPLNHADVWLEGCALILREDLLNLELP